MLLFNMGNLSNNWTRYWDLKTSYVIVQPKKEAEQFDTVMHLKTSYVIVQQKKSRRKNNACII